MDLMQAIEEALAPHFDRLETKLEAVETRIASFVPRRNITEAVKRRHIETIAALGRRCPCCGVNEVLSVDDEIVDGEFDHYYSRERRAFEETWLICKSCHSSMGDRTPHVAAFHSYQVRAKQIAEGQLVLFD